MSAMANTTLIVTTVTKAATKEKTLKESGCRTWRINILDFCEEHYEDIMSVIMDKIRCDKRKEVHTRLDFGDNTKRSRRIREGSQNSSAGTLSVRYRKPSKRPKVKDRLKDNDGNVFGRLGHWRQSAFNRLSDTYSPSTTKSGPDRESFMIILIVEVALTDETLLLAWIVLEVETAPMASKNHMVVLAPPTGQGPDMGIILATRIALVS
ncbi:hypothetical protein Tco_0581612 [Tanacetum coccineum]